jgi:hypothetical protein
MRHGVRRLFAVRLRGRVVTDLHQPAVEVPDQEGVLDTGTGGSVVMDNDVLNAVPEYGEVVSVVGDEAEVVDALVLGGDQHERVVVAAVVGGGEPYGAVVPADLAQSPVRGVETDRLRGFGRGQGDVMQGELHVSAFHRGLRSSRFSRSPMTASSSAVLASPMWRLARLRNLALIASGLSG